MSLSLDNFDPLQQALQASEADIVETYTRAKEHEGYRREQMTALRHASQRYLDSGIAFADNTTSLCLSLAGLRERDYFEKLASTVGRPFLWAERGTSYCYSSNTYKHVHYIELRVPRNKAMENIVSALLIMAKPLESAGNFRAGPLLVRDNTRSWKFYFVDDEGKTMFDNFAEMCRTNPVARILLKIPGR